MASAHSEQVKESLRVGITFGLTSAVITTTGLMVGLNASTGSRLAVIGGILTIAIADAFSDALGIHISEESENQHTPKEIWLSTIFTFLAKFFFALTFIGPVLLLKLPTAIMVNLIWGLGLLAVLSWRIAKMQNEKPLRIIAEHLLVAVVVIGLATVIGSLIAQIFN